MMQAGNGLLYVGLNNALQVYDNDRMKTVDVKDSQGHKLEFYVNCILQRRNGDILIGTSGWGILKITDNKTARQITRRGSELSFPRRMMEDKDGQLWIVTEDNGIFAIKGGHIMKHLNHSPMRNSFADICQNARGDIYAANINGGLYRLRRGSKDFELIQTSAGIPVVSLHAQTNGNILMGSNGQGLFEYNQATNSVTPIKLYNNGTDLSNTKIYSIITDRGGNLWVGLFQKGVLMMPAHKAGFEYIGYKSGNGSTIGDACVMCVHKGSNGTLWVATDNNGLYVLDSKGQLKHHFTHNGSSKSVPSTILGMTEDVRGRIWIGSFMEGCGWIDSNSGEYHRLKCTQGKARSVFDLTASADGHLWIGTMGDGLKCLNIATDEIKEYRNNPNQANSLYNDYIAQLTLSPDGHRLYVGTSVGLSCLDISSGSWLKTFGTNKIISGIPVFAIREDHHRVWVCTPQGLYRININNRKQKIYTTAQGLADDNTSSVEIDPLGRVWVSTCHGMSCLDPRTGRTSNYYVGDGLQGNEFSEGVSCNSGGKMIFGGMGGVTKFNPLKLSQREQRLKIFVTGFMVGGNEVIAGSASGRYTITDSTVTNTDRFELDHQDNTFSVMLSTFSYDNPEHIIFLYSVNGDKWIRLQQGKNEITFSHMPPGTYSFRVKAMDNKDMSDIHEFTIHIHPAWYFSIWAEIVYLLMLAAAIAWYLNMRRRKEQDHLRLQEHIHAEEMTEAKLRFFINISHEIRTPMTLIVAPLLSLLKDDKDPQRQSVYKTIRRNAERILNLINQMMDLRKIDKGQMAMRMSETDIIGFTKDIYNLFGQQAKTKNISLIFKHDDESLNVWIDRGNFDKVLMNILSNAFKFTPSGGEIIISIKHDVQHVTIAVNDNGEKIPEDKLEKIFQRFYQNASITNDRQTGTGIGLDLTRSLVELHHGTITAANNANGHGCTFTVTIPMGNGHLKPEEMIVACDEKNNDNPLNESNIDDNAEEEVNITQKPDTGNKRRQTIVVVEDDMEIRTYLSNELGDEFRIIECADGKEALPVILREIPALVISDIMMPEMDGNTLCSKIKANVNTNHIPVILLTAKSRDEDRLEGLETGADAYIIKPFNMDILRRTVINLLNARNLMRNKFIGNENQDDKVDDIKMKSPDEKLLERVMTTINSNLGNPELSVDMIAEEVGISRVHLHRKMKELTNQTPHDLIRNIRLKQAANLLANQRHNITEVMYACGFSNAASFSTMFRNMYGMSPREYIKEHMQQYGK